MAVDARSRMDDQSRLRALSTDHRDDIIVTCTHDPVEPERAQAMQCPPPPKQNYPRPKSPLY